jgi:glyoxylase-like metal-dependent hydrolase (beta-lactamase superfamily II)
VGHVTDVAPLARETAGGGLGWAPAIGRCPADPEGVAEVLRRLTLVPVAVLVTTATSPSWRRRRPHRRFSVSAYLHPDDEWLATDPVAQLRALWGMVPPGEYTPPERYEHLADESVLALAGFEVRVVHTPGHTPGHCCFHLAAEGILFSGDQLFAGSIGRTDLPGGDYDTLMRSMAERVVTLAPETAVFPGHGPTTTLARELATNPFLEELRP